MLGRVVTLVSENLSGDIKLSLDIGEDVSMLRMSAGWPVLVVS